MSRAAPVRKFLVMSFFLTLALISLRYAHAFVPGFSTKTYVEGEKIELKVNGLTSVEGQLPYSYYYLPYCRPASIVSQVETLGEILLGETVENSDYKIEFLKDESCVELCRMTLDPEQRLRFTQLISDDYSAHFLVDGLPAVFPYSSRDNLGVEAMSVGIPVGWRDPNSDPNHFDYFVYNYISIIIKYRPLKQEADSPAKYQIVGFEVVPISVKVSPGSTDHCPVPGITDKRTSKLFHHALNFRRSIHPSKMLKLETTNEIIYLYDVKWELSDISYGDRWNSYLKSQNVDIRVPSIRWFSVMSSLGVVLFLFVSVGAIVLRTVHRDITHYNQIAIDSEAILEESGWKLVHGDVFRKPLHATVLAALTGTGLQLVGTLVATLLIASGGVFIQSTGFGRGRLLQIALFLWSIMGIAGGYTSAIFYKLFQSPNWKLTSIRTAMIYPGVVFGLFLIVNLFIRFTNSSAAVSPIVILLLVVIWFGISAPLIFLGSYFGYKRETIQLPCRVNRIPRAIPAQPISLHPVICCFFGGLLPFTVIFSELAFVLGTIWNHQPFILFGFVLLITLILILTCAGISISVTYILLSSEDYSWWWQSFFVPGSSSIFVFAYSLLYMVAKLRLNRVASVVLYLGVSGFMSFTYFVLTGTVGFISSFLFVRAIYGSIKVD